MSRTVPLFSMLLLLLCDAVLWAHGFNLETRLPIVKRSNNAGSYFGYSVAGHQSVDEVKGLVEHSWILVGAPLDKNLQPNTNRSGALWKCPLTSLYYDCEQIITDGKRTIDSSNLSPPMNNEMKEEQWLGVTVRSQGCGKKVMVCAHRYINRGDDYQWGQGLCYTLTQNLDFSEVWKPCSKGETNKGHKELGFCQAGTSGVLLDDDTIIMGSPGSYNWKGSIFMTSVSDPYLERHKDVFYSPMRDTDHPPTESNSYLGMSTTAGLFLDHQTMVYVAGAPRSNGTGQVILFTKSTNTVMLLVNLVISGEQFASNFGYELANADLNGDKKPDLIVGAPFYFNKETGGAVYIYMNDNNYCLTCNPPIKLVGKPESRFGFAITNLGDLNKDGYEDIAIGAPYEGNGVVYIYQGSFNGINTKPLQIIKAEDLVVKDLEIRTFGYSLSGNAMDLDQNGYPDLISGAYESDMAILIRARPIVNLTISVDEDKIINIDPTNISCSVNESTLSTCFTFQTCCLLESVVKAGSSRERDVLLRYKLEAETFQEGHKFSRVWFGPNHTLKSHISENIVSIDHNKKLTCQTHTAYIKENTMDIQSPIGMRISYSLEQNNVPVFNPGDPVPSLDDFPVLNKSQAMKIFFATFHKDCQNVECESQVHLNAELALPKRNDNDYNLVMGEHVEILLNMTAYNTGESAYESRLFISHSPSFNYIGTGKLENTKQIDCNPFNKTTVVCALGNPFKKSASSNIQLRFDPKELNDAENQVEFIVTSNSTSHEVDPQSPLILRIYVIKHAELSLKGMARPEQVFYGGVVKDDSSVKYRDEVGSKILHTYQVFNSGPWKVSNLEVHINWPYQMSKQHLPDSSPWLLYLDEKPYVEAFSGGECVIPAGQVNPLGLTIRPGVQEISLNGIHSQSSTWDKFMISKSSSDIHKNNTSFHQNRIRRDLNNDEKLDCLLGTANCFKISCKINNLQSNQEATIFIKARLWNSTLIQFFPKVDRVQIASRGKIHIPPNLLLVQDHLSDDEVKVETFAKVDTLVLQENEPIAWWIYVLAILAGLLLLILLTLLLWKLGFFKRRRPDPTLSGNIEKHRVDEYYDY